MLVYRVGSMALEEFREVLDYLITTNAVDIIAGDFNYDLLKVSPNKTRINYYWTPDLWSPFKKIIVFGKSYKSAQVYEEGHIKPVIVDLLLSHLLKTKNQLNYIYFKLNHH